MKKLIKCISGFVWACMVVPAMQGCHSTHFRMMNASHTSIPRCEIEKPVKLLLCVSAYDEDNRLALVNAITSTFREHCGEKVQLTVCEMVTKRTMAGFDRIAEVDVRVKYDGSGWQWVDGRRLFGIIGGWLFPPPDIDYKAIYDVGINTSVNGEKRSEQMHVQLLFTYSSLYLSGKDETLSESEVRRAFEKYDGKPFSTRYFMDNGEAKDTIIHPLIETHLQKSYYPYIAESVVSYILRCPNFNVPLRTGDCP